MTSTEIQEKQASLVAWMSSSLYADRNTALRLDLSSNSEQILSLVPENEANISALLQLHGARQCILVSLNEFEVIRDNLDNKLKEMLEVENARAK